MLHRASPIDRVVILNDATTARGGATGLALLSIRLLRARGVAVTYIVGDDGESDELEALGVEIVAMGGKQLVAERRLTALTRGICNTRAEAGVAEWIAGNDTPRTIYHVHGWSKILSPSIFSALRPVASRTYTHAHDYFLACPNGAYMDYPHEAPCTRVPLGLSCLGTNCDKRSYPQKLWRSARRVALDKARGPASWRPTIMIHEAMAPAMERAGYDSQNLVALRNPAGAFSSERVRAEDNSLFCFIGRVEREKGIEDALAAAAKAGVRLRVIGDGPLREELAARWPDVEFTGWASRDQVSELVRDARCVVVPSRYPEPFGLVIAEAAQSGIPVIVSDTALLAADVANLGLGLSTTTRDIDAFAAAMERIRDLPRDEIESMSRRGFAGTSRLASTDEAWADGLMALYETSLVEAA